MASPTRWTWVWVNSGSWWWTGRPVCCDSWGHKESDTTERLNWLNWLSGTQSWPLRHVTVTLTQAHDLHYSEFFPWCAFFLKKLFPSVNTSVFSIHLNKSTSFKFWCTCCLLIFCWLFQRVRFSSYLRIVQIVVHFLKSICRIKEDGRMRNKWKLFSSLRIEKRASGYYWFDVGHNYDFVLLLLFIPIIIIYHVRLIFFFFCNISHVFSPLYSHGSPPWLGCVPHRLRPESHKSFRTVCLPSPILSFTTRWDTPTPRIISALSHASGWIPQSWNLDFPLHHNFNSLLLPP